ncbi:MAG: hypothetical protein DRO67_00605 [Candidatus Asgardarchaeum californiense]|nr:MAG: hypothetical protein DRO67_00605 [Candidatus Asgardarchaeum californiense]
MNNDFQGVSLRDQFAMSALIGVLSSLTLGNEYAVAQEIAEQSYLIADAMLKERSKLAKSRYGKKKT